MKIFGQVLDTSNQPMSLANITIITGANANKMGEEADLDGNFVLQDASISPESEFRISYIGYIPQFFKASELQGKKIKLLEDIENLGEVVVFSGGNPKKDTVKQPSLNKLKFKEHLVKHKSTYAGIVGLAGVLLIVKSLNK